MAYLHVEDEAPTVGNTIPKGALALAGAFALTVIALAGFARISHQGTLGELPHGVAVASRALVFSDRADGSIGVYDASRHQELAALTGTGGFVRGALRALARQRHLAHVGPEVPFYLVRWSDGRLTLDDSSTANHLELQAFGSSNYEAFAALLVSAPTKATATVLR